MYNHDQAMASAICMKKAKQPTNTKSQNLVKLNKLFFSDNMNYSKR